MSNTRSLRWNGRDVVFLSARSCRFAALMVLAWLIVAAAIVTGRGFAGALRMPLEPAALLTAGAVVAAAGVVVRLGWLLSLGDTRIGPRDHVVQASTTFAVAFLYVALSHPSGTPAAALIALRLLFVAEEGWAWLWFFRRWQHSTQPATKSGTTFRIDAPHPQQTRHDVGPVVNLPEQVDSLPHEPIDTAPPPEVTQQLTRSRAADGTEELFGWLRTPFAAGQRTGSVHVAFCPPLEMTPEVEVEQIDGPEARIKTAQLLPYGARFDLKLTAAADSPTTVVLQFVARSPSEE
jgi:hypothetical protein